MGGTKGAGMCDLRPQSQQQGGGLGPLGTLPATTLESQSQDRKEPIWSQGISAVQGVGCSKRPAQGPQMLCACPRHLPSLYLGAVMDFKDVLGLSKPG